MTSREGVRKPILAGVLLLIGSIASVATDQPSVKIDSRNPAGMPLKKETQTAVINDYLQAWQSMDHALQENRADLLDPYFVGTADQKLTDTIRKQQELGISTRYRDSSHNLSLLFYSPEGLSIQLLDKVEYDVQVLDHDKELQTAHVSTSYVVVLTPTEVRWKVRIFQAKPE